MKVDFAASACAIKFSPDLMARLWRKFMKYGAFQPNSENAASACAIKLSTTSYGATLRSPGSLRAVLKCAINFLAILWRKIDEIPRTLAGCAIRSLILQNVDGGTPRATPIARVRHKVSPYGGLGALDARLPWGRLTASPSPVIGIGPGRFNQAHRKEKRQTNRQENWQAVLALPSTLSRNKIPTFGDIPSPINGVVVTWRAYGAFMAQRKESCAKLRP